MNLLGNVLYDPAVAVTKGAAASVLAVFDTTNARIAFVVPPSGMVRVVIQCTVHGATTFSQIILGCLEGATVRGRVIPVGSQNGTALATTMMSQVADYVVSGLTPAASLTWDAAWGVETFVASSLIKYGGPNNTVANDNFGALIFQIWDPCPIYTPTSATAPATAVSARVDSIKTKTDFLPSATAGAAGGVFIAGTNAATTITTGLTTTFTGNLTGSVASVTGAVGSVTGAVGSVTGNVGGNIVGSVASVTAAVTVSGDLSATMKTSVTTACTASTPTAAAVTGAVGSVTGLTASDVGAIKTKTDQFVFTIPNFVDATATAVGDSAGVTTLLTRVPGVVPVATDYTATRATLLDNLDAAVSSRLATAGYSAPLTAAGTRSAVGLASANLDTQLSTIDDFLDTEVAAIKAKTDQLAFSVAGEVDVNVHSVNNVTVTGTGAPGDRWGS